MDSHRLGFAGHYRALPSHFYAEARPEPAPLPRVLLLNETLAGELGLAGEPLRRHAADWFSGARLPADAWPIACAYAGHQFGHFVPQLGDGRALLLGELRHADGGWREVQLKGAGRTRFSRRGDGRAALGPVLREYLVSEAMHALGIPTTRALAATLTGGEVVREELLPGAVLTRVASSHLRVGSFQYFAARGDRAAIERLLQFAIERHYPALREEAGPALGLLAAVSQRQASLVARWMLVGFVHGVMNTDNMSIGGETLDFGPCAFIDAYDPNAVFSSIDQQGRYAYGNQPAIAQWNLARLAECLLPLIDDDSERALRAAQDVIEAFPAQFQQHFDDGLRRKLGLNCIEPEDSGLFRALFDALHTSAADFTLTFRTLQQWVANADAAALPEHLAAWLPRWQARLQRDPLTDAERLAQMRSANPLYIPRNGHVEAALRAAHQGDLRPLLQLHDALQRPFDEHPEAAALAAPIATPTQPYRTFCGT